MRPKIRGFPRRCRLVTPSQFQRVFQTARCKSQDDSLTLLAISNGLDYGRLGLAISKKKLSLAHARNRLKRIVRESFRQHQTRLAGFDLVIVNRSGMETKTNAQLFAALRAHWDNVAHKCAPS